MKKYDVFGVESGCLDLNVCIDEMPPLNHGTGVYDMSWQGGGKVSSGMIAAARLGAKCTISGALGDDDYGRVIYNDFVRHGVNVSNLTLREGKTTSLDIVLAEKKSMTRTMLFHGGTNEAMSPEEVNWDLLLDSKLLFIAGYRDMPFEAARRAKRRSGRAISILSAITTRFGEQPRPVRRRFGRSSCCPACAFCASRPGRRWWRLSYRRTTTFRASGGSFAR